MIVDIYRGTNIKNGKDIINGEYNKISWWANDYETICHYYEGCVLHLKIKLDQNACDYVRSEEELQSYDNYTYGMIEVLYPEGAIWYSISKDYITNNSITINEIDLEELTNIF